MRCEKRLALLLIAILVIPPPAAWPQFDPGEMPVKIFEILDLDRTRLGWVLVAGHPGRGYEAGNEYWRFSEEALVGIAEQSSLELTVVAEGEWDDPWVIRALDWRPSDTSVEWSHPAKVEWTPTEEGGAPVVPGGTYFGHPTLGGLTIRYEPGGPSSLTWFKLTEGDFMLLGDGAVFDRDAVPESGSWWQGPM